MSGSDRSDPGRGLVIRSNNVQSSATFEFFDSLIGMRRITIATIPALALLMMAAGASAAPARHALPAKCAQSSHTLLADAQAQIYSHTGYAGDLSIRGCIYGQRKSFFISACSNEESAGVCADKSHVTLAGAIIAYKYANVNSGKYPELEKSVNEWYVVVRNLRTGRVLHEVPTGTPLKAEPGSIGVGPVVALVLKSDGSVAWIAEDYERSATPLGTGAPYFDVYATDTNGTRLLASGSNVDPSSLGVSVGGSGVGGNGRTIEGSTLYWTQGGLPFSTTIS
jgi:hypothetical protein